MIKKIISFEDDFKAVAAYESLGFKCEVDDAVNNIICCEIDLSEFDALALLAVAEDCQRLNLNPMIQIGERIYNFDEGLVAADELAASDLI